jgi:hypothetical protein
MTPRKVSRETRRQAIRILGEAARTYGWISDATLRLGVLTYGAHCLAVDAYTYVVDLGGLNPYQESCAIAESLLRQGWEP